jgi:hypothetical protein
MWQEYWFAAAGCLYAIVLMPAILSPKTEMPRNGSIMTAVLMAGSGIAYGTLNMPMATAMMFVGAAQWTYLAVYRPLRYDGPKRRFKTSRRFRRLTPPDEDSEQPTDISRLGGC